MRRNEEKDMEKRIERYKKIRKGESDSERKMKEGEIWRKKENKRRMAEESRRERKREDGERKK